MLIVDITRHTSRQLDWITWGVPPPVLRQPHTRKHINEGTKFWINHSLIIFLSKVQILCPGLYVCTVCKRWREGVGGPMGKAGYHSIIGCPCDSRLGFKALCVSGSRPIL